MIGQPASWLMATALLAVLQFVAATIAIQCRQRRYGLMFVRVGIIGTACCAAIVVVPLMGVEEPPLQVSLWTWSSFSLQPSPAIVFGLEGDGTKAALVSLLGCGLLVVLRRADSKTAQSLSDDTILSLSLLFAGLTVFVFAPNLVQALLGWATAGIATGVLIRLSQQERRASDDLQVTSTRIVSGEPGRTASRSEQLFSLVGRTAAWIEQSWFDRVWQVLTIHFPNWIAEQIELLERGSMSIQLLTMTAAACAILLTWLL